jgi:hypothetical protein
MAEWFKAAVLKAEILDNQQLSALSAEVTSRQ